MRPIQRAAAVAATPPPTTILVLTSETAAAAGAVAVTMAVLTWTKPPCYRRHLLQEQCPLHHRQRKRRAVQVKAP